jgi:hypothetical protein
METAPTLPVPQITEGFMTEVVERLGGRRLNLEECGQDELNADYILPGAIAELKILEQDAIRHPSHQKRLAQQLLSDYDLPRIVDLDFEGLSENAKSEVLRVLGIPIGRAAEKADKQIDATKRRLGRENDFGVWIAVNASFHSLPAGEFEKLVLSAARSKGKYIDFVFCTTVSYHQGEFDGYVFCESHCHPVRERPLCELEDQYIKSTGEVFGDRMTRMMQRMYDPALWDWKRQDPIKDVIFTYEGVTFRKMAPEVPNSMFGDLR